MFSEKFWSCTTHAPPPTTHSHGRTQGFISPFTFARNSWAEMQTLQSAWLLLVLYDCHVIRFITNVSKFNPILHWQNILGYDKAPIIQMLCILNTPAFHSWNDYICTNKLLCMDWRISFGSHPSTFHDFNSMRVYVCVCARMTNGIIFEYTNVQHEMINEPADWRGTTEFEYMNHYYLIEEMKWAEDEEKKAVREGANTAWTLNIALITIACCFKQVIQLAFFRSHHTYICIPINDFLI